MQRAVVVAMVALTAVAGLGFAVACSDRSPSSAGTNDPTAAGVPAIPDVAGWGRRQATPGNFVKPRAVSAMLVADGDPDDPDDLRLLVSDRTTRLQIFDGAGELLQSIVLPAVDREGRGFPVGVAFCPVTGDMLVADTHYARMLRYAADGALLAEFGKWGTEPGRFIMPIRLALTPDGRMWIGDHGHDHGRLQLFDRDGTFIRAIGRAGEGPVEFARPNGIALGPDGNLFVADMGNDRVQVVSPTGESVRIFGDGRTDGGRLQTPFGIAYDHARNRVIVVEYTASRLAVFRPDGRLLGRVDDLGLAYPWDVTVAGNFTFIADAGNHRILRVAASRLPGAEPAVDDAPGPAPESAAADGRPAPVPVAGSPAAGNEGTTSDG
jgi:DNA-binding beta-propeller fold protein YncE